MTAREILAEVAISTGVSVDKIRGPRRWSELVRARRVAAVMMRAEGFSYSAIGRALGGRHHTSVLHLCKTADREEAPEAIEVAEARIAREVAEGLRCRVCYLLLPCCDHGGMLRP